MKRDGDSTFPGLVTALDVDAVLELVREAFPECRDDVELRGCTIRDVRYRPGGPCWILYQLKLRDGDGRSRRQFISARVLRPGQQPDRVPDGLLERYRMQRRTVLRTPSGWIRNLPMALYAFPLDAALPGLFDAVDEAVMREHLDRLWAERGVKVRRVSITPLGYTPQARAAFLYEVLAEDRQSALPELRHLIAKMHAKKLAPRLFADAWTAWRAAGPRAGLAPPVGYVSEVGLTLQEQVRGQRLGGLVTAAGFGTWVRRTARHLAALHGLSLPLSSRRKPGDEVEGAHRWAGVLMAIRPDLARRVERLRDRLAAEIESRARLSAPVHADFHHTNVLVDEGRIRIIDLDEMAFGDPMVDVGRFLASLRVPARRAFGDISALEDAGEGFLEEYLQRAGGDVRRARLFEAASLLIAAGSSFRIQRPGWEEEVSLLIEEAERVLERAGTDMSAQCPRTTRPDLRPEEQLRWATDGVYMQALLDPYIHAAYGARITRCRVRERGGASKRHAADYELRGWRDGKRWSISLRGTRREGGGRSLIRHLQALDSALEGVSDAPVLPRPVAYFPSLSLLMWDVPDGTPFSSLLESGDATAAAAAVGLALARLHRVRVDWDTRRAPKRELTRVQRKLESLSDPHPALFAAAGSLVGELERCFPTTSPRVGPVLGTVDPRHVLCDGDRVALDKVEDLALADPYVDAGDFLARLTLLGIRYDRVPAAESAADSFRDAYHSALNSETDGLAVYEATALLRLGCAQAGRESPAGVAELLIEEASARLGS